MNGLPEPEDLAGEASIGLDGVADHLREIVAALEKDEGASR